MYYRDYGERDLAREVLPVYRTRHGLGLRKSIIPLREGLPSETRNRQAHAGSFGDIGLVQYSRFCIIALHMAK